MPTRKKSTAIGIGKWPFFPQNSCKLPFLLLLQATHFFVVFIAVIVIADFAEIVDSQQQQMSRPMNGRLYANMEPCLRPTVRVLLPSSPLNANGGNGDNNDGLSISTMSTIPITHQTVTTGALSTSTSQQSLDSSAATTTATESIRTATTNSSNSMNSTSSSTTASSSSCSSSSTTASSSTTQKLDVGHFQIEIPFQQPGAAAGNVTIEAECAAQGPKKPSSRSVYTLDTAKINWTGANELLLFNDVHILAFGYPPLQPIGIA